MSTPEIIVACATLGITLDTPYKTAYSRYSRSGKAHPEAWQRVKTHLPKTRQAANTGSSGTALLRRVTLRRVTGKNACLRLVYILGTGSSFGPHMTIIEYSKQGNRYELDKDHLEHCVPPVHIGERDLVLNDGVDCRVELIDVGCADWEPWALFCVKPDFAAEGYAE